MLRRMLETSDIKSKELINLATNSVLNSLCGLFNVCNGNLPVKKKLIQGHENSFKKLLSNQTSLKIKRQIFALKVSFKRYCSLVQPSSKEVIMQTEEFILNSQKNCSCQHNRQN